MLGEIKKEERLRQEIFDLLETVDTRACCQIYEVLDKKYEELMTGNFRILVVDSGTTYIEAMYAERMLRETRKYFSTTLYWPEHASKSMKKTKYDVVLAVSHTGMTPKLRMVYEVYRTNKKPNSCFILFTGETPEKVGEINKEDTIVISYAKPGVDVKVKPDDNIMVSLVSIFALNRTKPRFLEACCNEGAAFVNNISMEKIAEGLRNKKVIDVYYEEGTEVAMSYAYEIMMSYFGKVNLWDKSHFDTKDYTYDKNGLRINLCIYNQTTKKNESLDHNIEKDSKVKDVPYIKIGSFIREKEDWSIEASIKVIYFYKALQEAMKKF